MKNVLIGCSVVLLLVVIGGGTLAWIYVVKPGMEVAGEFTQLSQEFEEADARIENQADYTPPQDELLDEAQVDRYLAAQRSIRATLGGRLQELEEKYKAFEQPDGGKVVMGFDDIMGAYGDFFSLLAEAKRAQVEALNAQGFSLAEYRWTRNHVYEALGQPVGQFSVEDGLSIEQFTKDGSGRDSVPAAPQPNVELVEPHREELMEMVALAWFGL